MEQSKKPKESDKRIVGIKLFGIISLIFIIVLAFSENNPINDYFKESKAWRNASKINTYDSYQIFITNFNKGKKIPEAKKRQEELVWLQAKQARNIKSVDHYQYMYGNGKYAKESIILKDSIIWDSLSNTIYTINNYLQNYPMGQFINQAKLKISELRNKSTFKDSRDGKTYRYVKIGNQTWMAQNLDFVTDAGNWCYENNVDNGGVYGRLYTWEVSTKACPSGWHLPSDAEWSELTSYLGGDHVAGDKLKEIDTTHWSSPNSKATNESGFEALPGGFLVDRSAYNNQPNIQFQSIGKMSIWWSSNTYSGDYAYDRSITNYLANVRRTIDPKTVGLSVRCVKD